MDKYKLKHLIKQGEGPKVDFKARLNISTDSEKKELTKDIIAIANSKGGRGYLIFGVEDKTNKILGIELDDFREEQIQQVIYNRCDPPVPISVEIVDYENKKLAVITIFKSYHQPHQMLQNGAFYVRRGSTTDTARRGELANLFQENGLMTYETVVLKNAHVSELDFNLINQYFTNLNVISISPSEMLLEAMGIVGHKYDNNTYHPTIGGMLLFGKDPITFLPHVYVKVVMGEDVRLFNGNVIKMLDDVTSYLKHLISDKTYPVDALCEAIANAIVHRDYLDISRGIAVTITNKNIEISNPGALIANNSIYKVIRENNPDRRNSWLYQRLLALDSKKRFLKSSLGLTKIKKAFYKIGDVKFLNIDTQNLFKVILPAPKVYIGNGKKSN